MCLSVPGKIIMISKDKATVDYNVEKRVGALIDKGYKVGDWVIIQGGFVVMKIPEKEAKQALELYCSAIQ